MKFKREDKITIITSIAVGGITALIANIYNQSLIYPIGAMLITTIIFRITNKTNYSAYKINMQFQFRKNAHSLVLTLVGIKNGDVSMLWVTVRNLGCMIDVERMNEALKINSIFNDENGCLHVNNQEIIESSFVNGYKALVTNQQLIMQLIEQKISYNSMATSSTNSVSVNKKRKSLLFWR